MATVADAGESREDILLKTGTRKSLCSCNEDWFSGTKFISFAFGILSAVITVALLVQIYYGDYQVIPHGSVASDSKECSVIGTAILKDGGNSIDASIATAFCLAVVNPHTTGLDAGGQFLIYSHQTRINPLSIDFTSIGTGQLPRLVTGLAYVHKKFATLPWKQLVEPAAHLATCGFAVPNMLLAAIKNYNAAKLFRFPQTEKKITMHTLGEALQRIANIQEEALYQLIQQDEIMETQAATLSFNDYSIFVPGKSPMGLVLFENLKGVQNENFTKSDTKKAEYFYQLALITEKTYSDINITRQFYEGTTSNVAVMDLDDLYVSLVTGMYAPFGTRQMTPNGYLLDVKESLPASRLPVIITDRDFICGRRIVLGVNDVATATQLISSLLLSGENATVGVENARFNIRGDGLIGIEDAHTILFNVDVIKQLQTLSKVVGLNQPYNSCNVVEKTGDDLNSHSDSRGGGIASRF